MFALIRDFNCRRDKFNCRLRLPVQMFPFGRRTPRSASSAANLSTLMSRQDNNKENALDSLLWQMAGTVPDWKVGG